MDLPELDAEVECGFIIWLNARAGVELDQHYDKWRFIGKLTVRNAQTLEKYSYYLKHVFIVFIDKLAHSATHSPTVFH